SAAPAGRPRRRSPVQDGTPSAAGAPRSRRSGRITPRPLEPPRAAAGRAPSPATRTRRSPLVGDRPQPAAQGAHAPAGGAAGAAPAGRPRRRSPVQAGTPAAAGAPRSRRSGRITPRPFDPPRAAAGRARSPAPRTRRSPLVGDRPQPADQGAHAPAGGAPGELGVVPVGPGGCRHVDVGPPVPGRAGELSQVEGAEHGAGTLRGVEQVTD